MEEICRHIWRWYEAAALAICMQLVVAIVGCLDPDRRRNSIVSTKDRILSTCLADEAKDGKKDQDADVMSNNNMTHSRMNRQRALPGIITRRLSADDARIVSLAIPAICE